jgi:hypothetical protein
MGIALGVTLCSVLADQSEFRTAAESASSLFQFWVSLYPPFLSMRNTFPLVIFGAVVEAVTSYSSRKVFSYG